MPRKDRYGRVTLPLRTKYIGVLVESCFIVRGGDIYIGRNVLWNFGIGGYIWSTLSETYSSVTSAKSEFFSIYFNDIKTSESYHRWLGFPVRCLVYVVTYKDLSKRILPYGERCDTMKVS